MIKCCIVEDELMSRKSLERLCQKREDIELVSSIANPQEAMSFLSQKKIDILLLGTDLPLDNGIRLSEAILYQPSVVRVISTLGKVRESYQYQVCDYLQRPITQPQFTGVMDKLVQNHRTTQFTTTRPQLSSDIFVKQDGRYLRLSYEDILYIENIGDYVKIRTSKSHFVVYSTMKSLEERLPVETFFRVHRTFIVNLNKIIDIEEANLVILDKVIPISRANKPDLIARLNIL